MRQLGSQIRWARYLLKVTCHVKTSTCLNLEASQVGSKLPGRLASRLGEYRPALFFRSPAFLHYINISRERLPARHLPHVNAYLLSWKKLLFRAWFSFRGVLSLFLLSDGKVAQGDHIQTCAIISKARVFVENALNIIPKQAGPEKCHKSYN
jgi:hypothetical protein